MNVPNQLTKNHMLFIMLFCMICTVLHAQYGLSLTIRRAEMHADRR